jgi:hypothetical protein
MRKIVIVYGLISGAVVVFLMLMLVSFVNKGSVNFDNAEYFGYGSMIIALSMVFFGIKSYRESRSNGSVTFFKGVQIGLLITLIASVMYAGGWEAYLQLNPGLRDEFIQKYIGHQAGKMKESGAPQAEIDQFLSQMNTMAELYKNPVVRFGMTLMEIVPVGLIVTLLSAALLRKREVLPT